MKNDLWCIMKRGLIVRCAEFECFLNFLYAFDAASFEQFLSLKRISKLIGCLKSMQHSIVGR